MKPDFSGVWKANLENSTVFGPSARAMSASIHHAEPELRLETFIVKPDGTKMRTGSRFLTTGEEVTNPIYGTRMRSRCQWMDSELLIESWVTLRGRDWHTCDFWSLSEDGQTLTMEHRDDDLAGQIVRLERTDQEVE
jgi:hypothetical protein